MRRLVPAIMLLTCCLSLCGKGRAERAYPRFTFGVEGDYAMTLLGAYHYNYIAEEGDRINLRGVTSSFISNGQILLNAGVNVSPKVNISVECGWCGVYREVRIIPFLLRGTWFSGRDPMRNRWLAYVSVGGGVNDDAEKLDRLSAIAKAGGGYRVSLNRFAKLDFLFSLHGTFAHPRTYRNAQGSVVSGNALRRSDAYVGAVTFGIGLTF